MPGKGRPPRHRRLGANPMPGPTAELRLQPPGLRERNFYHFRGLRPAVLHYGDPKTRRASPHLKVFIATTSAEFLPPHKRTCVQVPGTGTQTSLPPTLVNHLVLHWALGRATTRKAWPPESPPAGKRHPWRMASNSGRVLRTAGHGGGGSVLGAGQSPAERTSGPAWEGRHAPQEDRREKSIPQGEGRAPATPTLQARSLSDTPAPRPSGARGPGT